MLNTQLSLEVSRSLNPKVLRLLDTSHYYLNEEVENYMIEVLPVNKSVWVNFFIKKGFSLALNASNLQYSTASKAEELVDLPDGIYEIKQSIKPNIHTVVHFYHFRTVSIRRTLQTKMTELLAEKCEISKDEFKKNREKLREIEEYIDAAQWEAEECGDKSKAKELYQWAEKLLEQYSNECQC